MAKQEYLLNNSGSWRIKAYNHYNEKYYYTGTSVQTQGVGIMYKKDFDKLSELFTRKRRTKRNQKENENIILPDSTKTVGGSLNSFVKLKQ